MAAPEILFPEQLKEVIGEPATDVELVAAYFVPSPAGVQSLASLAKRGVKVRILTNSLAASEGPYVHAGYTKYRKSLLKAGIALYEMRRLTPDTGEHKGAGLLGSSVQARTRRRFRWIARAFLWARSILTRVPGN